ncbi:fungal-specific transcription factor domain-containing protein [Mycena metata]|uniref:Fungal-specific transcription factor domain-containing protein n=1 Tax=Mycena metata TaxID=1033252 RepID=A0AAD7JGI7_9AGAR|nr:fungal-specific transcription factor domain-containing protein [Mycena metata]
MLANEEELEADSRGKRRRIQRACDLCRRRKSDGSEIPGSQCTTCLDSSVDCTYREAPVQLDQSMVLINQLRSELAAAHFKGTSPGPAPASRIDTATALTPPTPINNAYDQRAATMGILRARLRAFALPSPPPTGDDLDHMDLARNLEKLSLGRPTARAFFGKGSGATMVTAVLGIKADVERSEARSRGHTPEHSLGNAAASVWDGSNWTSRRMRFWTFKPWQRTVPRGHAFTLPPAAMINHLTELYFTHQNVYVPLLHRPTFERSLADGLHFRDYDFAATVILVCAIASRWSTDPEVFHLGADTTAGGGGLTSGWRWFNQVRDNRTEMSGPASLYDLQYYCLAVQFLECSSEPQICWTLVGFGLRRAQDIGAHRRTAPHEVPSIQSELLKRAFWVLMYMDRLMSAGTGRTCALEESDVDIEMPIECDDEYWEHPTHPFQQPPGPPSKVVFFNRILRLNHLLAFSLKLLYPLNKTRATFAFDDAFEETLVAELDSALNDWYEGIPAHLRWDPQRRDLVFFNQSVALHCKYHHPSCCVRRGF